MHAVQTPYLLPAAPQAWADQFFRKESRSGGAEEAPAEEAGRGG